MNIIAARSGFRVRRVNTWTVDPAGGRRCTGRRRRARRVRGNSTLSSFVRQELLDLPSHRTVPAVLDGVVRAPRQGLGDVGPARAAPRVAPQYNLVLGGRPGQLADVGVQLVVPPLPALLGDAPGQLLSYRGPLSGAVRAHLRPPPEELQAPREATQGAPVPTDASRAASAARRAARRTSHRPGRHWARRQHKWRTEQWVAALLRYCSASVVCAPMPVPRTRTHM